jgi:KaiC/GvpD/RAD55 family RecA-like ATPase
MTAILRFGIPSLDHLFGKIHPEVEDPKPKPRQDDVETDELQYEPERHGIHLTDDGSASICIIGPDGTGKSVLGLHLASSYMSDCITQGSAKPALVPRVLYVSTDLKFEMAQKMWRNFALDSGALRRIPFSDDRMSFLDQRRKAATAGLKLVPCHPLGIEMPGEDLGSIAGERARRLASVLMESRSRTAEPQGIYFVDLATLTAGDDWGFVNRMLAVLDPPGADKAPRHLMIVDSVEGFETLVGEHDAFGESHPRRSRIAQVMRSAANKCHIVFIVEEKRDGERLPEEFVTDVVMRLRTTTAKDYVRRTIEIEKSRGQSHVRGQHSYVIRGGFGSTTGLRPNEDDPEVVYVGGESSRRQGYVHICPSLHRIGRGVMESTGKGIPPKDAKRYAGFGIHYLDDMLAGTDEPLVEPASDMRGLPCSTTTALMGDPETQKTQLGLAFLSRSFKNYAKRLYEVAKILEDPIGNAKYLPTLLEAIAMRLLWKHSARFIDDVREVLYDENWNFRVPFTSLSALANWINAVPLNSPLSLKLKQLFDPDPQAETPSEEWKPFVVAVRNALRAKATPPEIVPTPTSEVMVEESTTIDECALPPLCEAAAKETKPFDESTLPSLLEAIVNKLLWDRSDEFINGFRALFYDANCNLKTPFDPRRALLTWLEQEPRSALDRDLKRLFEGSENEASRNHWGPLVASLRDLINQESECHYERPIPTLLEGIVRELLSKHSDQEFIKEFHHLFFDARWNLKTPFDSLEIFSHWVEHGPWASALKSEFAPSEDKKWNRYVVCLRKRLRHPLEPSYVRTLQRDLKKELKNSRKQGQAKDQREYAENKGLARSVANAAWLLCEPYHIHDGVPVLLTTKDTNVERLSNTFVRLLVRENPEFRAATEEFRKHDEYAESPIEKALRLHIQTFTICRRLEIHDLPSPVLIHILQRNVEAAQRFVFGDHIPKDTRRRFGQTWRIRLVMDDFSILRKSHPEISDEPLVLPFIMFYLRREGVTSLIIDTQAGSPKIPATEFEKELRTLIQHHLYTWRFPFYGENRIAIAAIPPISNDLPAVVRELKERREHQEFWGAGDRQTGHPSKSAIYIEEGVLDVDPHFELYSGIEEGKPEPVPLEVRLYAETPAVKQYIRDENVRYRELFKPATGGVGRHAGDVMRPMQADEYEVFRDFCYLQRDTRLDHTLVCQVDEFWSLRRPGMRRAGAFRWQNKYLDSLTIVEGEINRAVDPFGVFQMTGQDPIGNIDTIGAQPRETAGTEAEESKAQAGVARKRHRFDFFGNNGYEPDFLTHETKSDRLGAFIDRIPFVWDFGFLLCRKKLWDRYSDEKLLAVDDGKALTIGRVWRDLPSIVKSNQVVWDVLNKLKSLQRDANAELKTELVACSNEIEAFTHSEDYVTAVRPRLEEILGVFPTEPELSAENIKALRDRLTSLTTVANSTPATTSRPSWRAFLEACHRIAQKEGPRTPAFDLSVIAQQSLACLVLEIWASEIYSSIADSVGQRGFANPISRRAWAASSERGGDFGLIEWLEDEHYRLQLLKGWLLLVESINISEMAAALRGGGFKGQKANRAAVAARYWYKTAGTTSREFSHDDPLVPVGLPGHFSVRGDWFLAVASGSRSERLADRALDLLSSRRSNFARLEQGIGLPTRDIGEGYWRTNLVTVGREGRGTTVTYSELCSLGVRSSPPEEQTFYWLWRSRLRDYPRHMRIFQEWLSQIVLWWDLMRNSYTGDAWMEGFRRYDQVAEIERNGRTLSESDDETLRRVWQRFELFLNSLKKSLQQANRATVPKPSVQASRAKAPPR